MEYWNNGMMIPFQKNQYSSIPAFQHSREAKAQKSIRYDNLSSSKRSFLGKSALYLVFATFGVLFFPVSASAHKVTVFAWVDGDTIHTQSKFSGGKRVKNALIRVYDAKNKLLLQGKTNENGMFSFKIPEKTALKIVLKASMGHMAVWKLPAEEIGTAESIPPVEPTAMGIPLESDPPASPEPARQSPEAKPMADGRERWRAGSGSIDPDEKEEPSGSSKIVLDRREIEEMINASLDKKLRPITEMLADAVNREPGFTEIIGGIGYILGLVGIALYLANRKKQ
jgi:nickel transport protein